MPPWLLGSSDRADVLLEFFLKDMLSQTWVSGSQPLQLTDETIHLIDGINLLGQIVGLQEILHL